MLPQCNVLEPCSSLIIFFFQVLYNLIKHFQIKYLAIVASDDEFGAQGTEVIKQMIEEDGHRICLPEILVMKNRIDAYHVVDTLADLQKNLNQKNLPVLFIGQYADVKDLITASETNKQAKRFLWFFPDSVGIKAELLELGRNAFSTSPFYSTLDGFRTYWTGTIHRHTQSGLAKHEYKPFIEYVESLLGCSSSTDSCARQTLQQINNAYSQSSYINTALYAAAMLGKAIKILHFNKCGPVNGSCPEFEQALKPTSASLKDTIKSISLDSSDEDVLPFLSGSIPEAFQFQFRSNGELTVQANQSVYLIHNAICDPDCHFQIVSELPNIRVLCLLKMMR